MFRQYYRSCPANHYPYTIQPGDTLYYISLRLEVSLSRIMAANPGLDPYRLRVGQTICIPACPPNHTPYMIQAGDTLNRIAQLYQVTVASILEANPGIDPNDLRIAQRICIPSVSAPGASRPPESVQAMQSDIDMLKQESSIQQTHESNYGTSDKVARVVTLTGHEIKFDAAPTTFTGNYQGHYTAGKSYPYYPEAAMGGRRSITVKDNFGVWHSFGYQVPIGQ